MYRNLLYTVLFNDITTRDVKANIEKGHTTSTRDDRFIVSSAHTHTGSDIRNQLKELRQVTVFVKTVERRLNEAGLLSRRPVKGPLLETRHRVERLQFAKNMIIVPRWIGAMIYLLTNQNVVSSQTMEG